jgi:hypothetical protein
MNDARQQLERVERLCASEVVASIFEEEPGKGEA